jgi:hypothetical protein
MNPFTLFILRTLAWIVACVVSVGVVAVWLIRAKPGADMAEFWAVAIVCALVCEIIRPDRERLEMLMHILRDRS